MAEATTSAAIDAATCVALPWLVLIGHRRSGWFSYDWRASRPRILAQHERLRSGDVPPERRDGVVTPRGYGVQIVDRVRALVQAGRRNLVSGVEAPDKVAHERRAESPAAADGDGSVRAGGRGFVGRGSCRSTGWGR